MSLSCTGKCSFELRNRKDCHFRKLAKASTVPYMVYLIDLIYQQISMWAHSMVVSRFLLVDFAI